jgi:hypothetical protein
MDLNISQALVLMFLSTAFEPMQLKQAGPSTVPTLQV